MITAPILNKSIHKTLDWLYDIESFCGWDDQKKTLAVLRATLHELRDLLPIETIAHLSAQLPLLIRGIFFEGWNPNRTPSRERKQDDFLDSIAWQLERYDIPNIEQAVRNTLTILSQKIDPHEIDKIKKILPKEIRSFFD
jgi:uncharacterized protein (DUF2267 family)